MLNLKGVELRNRSLTLYCFFQYSRLEELVANLFKRLKTPAQTPCSAKVCLAGCTESAVVGQHIQ